MSEGIDWKQHDEDYLYALLGRHAGVEHPGRRPDSRSPMQRVMRQIKELRGHRYYYHIHPGGWVSHQLKDFEHESWFQLPAPQKEERLLRQVDWSGVSEKARAKVIAWQFRSRDGEINAQDEYRLHDQLMRVEATTPNWSELSSTAKLEKLLDAPGVDWRPFPPEFQAIALGHTLSRTVRPAQEGFAIVGGLDAKGDYPQFGRHRSSGRGGYEQARDKGPKRPVFSKAEARRAFEWAVAAPHREAAGGVTPGDARFRERMRPLWREFWHAAKTKSHQGLSELARDHYRATTARLEQRDCLASPNEIARDAQQLGRDQEQGWPSVQAESRLQVGNAFEAGNESNRAEVAMTEEDRTKLYLEWAADYASRREESAKPESPKPTPSEIMDGPEPYRPELNAGPKQSHERGRSK